MMTMMIAVSQLAGRGLNARYKMVFLPPSARPATDHYAPWLVCVDSSCIKKIVHSLKQHRRWATPNPAIRRWTGSRTSESRASRPLRSVETAQAAVADAVSNDDDEVQGECYVLVYKKWSDGSIRTSRGTVRSTRRRQPCHQPRARRVPRRLGPDQTRCTPADVCEYIWQDGRHAYCSMTEGIEGAVDPSQTCAGSPTVGSEVTTHRAVFQTAQKPWARDMYLHAQDHFLDAGSETPGSLAWCRSRPLIRVSVRLDEHNVVGALPVQLGAADATQALPMDDAAPDVAGAGAGAGAGADGDVPAADVAVRHRLHSLRQPPVQRPLRSSRNRRPTPGPIGEAAVLDGDGNQLVQRRLRRILHSGDDFLGYDVYIVLLSHAQG